MSTSLTQPSKAAPTTVFANKKSRRQLYWIFGSILALAALVGAAIVRNKGKDRAILVTTEKAVIKTITQLVNATGKVQPEVEVKIAPEVAGEIIELPFREGAAVKKDELVVRIKPDNYRYQVEQQEANLIAAKTTAVQAKSQLLKAQDDFKRIGELFGKQLVSDSDFSTAKTNLEVAQAGYDNALAQISRNEGLLSQSQDLLSKTSIYAPMDGTVSSRTSEVGERVVGTGSFSGTEIMRVADLANMEVRVNVNENDIVNVKVGDLTRIAIDAYPGRKFTGTVREIASTATTQGLNTQEEVTNFLVKIRIVDKNVSFRPGMSATVDIETKTVQNVIAIPTQSVTVRSRADSKTLDELKADREKKARETQGEGAATAVSEKQQLEREKADRETLQRVVFVRTGDTVKMVPVETGIGDTTHLEIKSGLKEGDEVVSGPFSVITRTLKDGMKIRVEAPKAKVEVKK